MLLYNFGYIENNWETDLLGLNPQNLFVGKNAVGKSRTIKHIAQAAAIISERESIDNLTKSGYAVSLGHDNDTILYYQFAIIDGKVSKETLYVYSFGKSDKTVIIDRNETLSTINGETINPPQNKLIIHVRRDTIEYPVLETLITWASNVEGLNFNELENDGDSNLDARIQSGGTDLFTMVRSFDEASKESVVSKAAAVGYFMNDIVPVEVGSMLKVVLFSEQGIKEPMFCSELSKGMFRTLYLLIYLEYLSNTQKPATLLIDDLCEGLDYERSTKLGKIVFDFCEKNDIQLIASSNDSFLMDVVDLKYWNIITREGSKLTAINQARYPELFEDFRFTGLSNFDLLSSDYIARHMKK